ncbi:hypothetical protein MNBD_GAMMA21-1475 [hydrothermal vent metagenome]|uniref:Lipoprotein n=1 Tax=hydrothermal vent metagenome TaxID=652676 RepID=A0A3B1A5Z3_9ZZZZ
MNKYILFLILMMVAGCSETVEYKYQPLENVGVNVFVAKIEVKEEGKTFIQFKYVINNNSPSPVTLKPASIRIIVNGEKSEFVRNNDLASAPEAETQLEKGDSEHEFYLMVNKVFENREIREFRVVNFGLK